jgi:hypothetical protein
VSAEHRCAICDTPFPPTFHRGQPVKFCGPVCRKEHKKRLKQKPGYREKAKAWRNHPDQRARENARERLRKTRRKKAEQRFEPFPWIPA